MEQRFEHYIISLYLYCPYSPLSTMFYHFSKFHYLCGEKDNLFMTKYTVWRYVATKISVSISGFQ